MLTIYTLGTQMDWIVIWGMLYNNRNLENSIQPWYGFQATFFAPPPAPILGCLWLDSPRDKDYHFIFKKLDGMSVFYGATDILVLDLCWCLPWDSKPEWIFSLHASLPGFDEIADRPLVWHFVTNMPAEMF